MKTPETDVVLSSSRGSLRLLNGQATSRDAADGLPFGGRSTVGRLSFSGLVTNEGRESTISAHIAA